MKLQHVDDLLAFLQTAVYDCRRTLTGKIREVRWRKPFRPRLWGFSCHTTEICLKGLVGSFCLTISLWVVRGGVFQINSLHSEQLFPNLTKECGVAVTDDVFRHTMELEDVIKIYLSNLDGRVGVRECDEMSILAESVNDDHDAMFPT